MRFECVDEAAIPARSIVSRGGSGYFGLRKVVLSVRRYPVFYWPRIIGRYVPYKFRSIE